MTKPKCSSEDYKRAMCAHGRTGVNLQMDVASLMSIVALIQLALRHPGVRGPSGVLARQIIGHIQENLCQFDQAFADLIADGFDEACDVPPDPKNAEQGSVYATLVNIPLLPFRIEKLWAYLVQDEDGAEAVLSMSLPGGIVAPMIGADEHRVRSLRLRAEMISAEIKQRVVLCEFSQRTEVEEIG